MISEGSLQAPTRHRIDWQAPEFYDEDALFKEMERVFDVCHGCRRCFSLCNAFPTLFDAVDESSTGEVDGVARPVYWQVVDHCYLCDMCYMSKCPYVPPHPWNIDFPHLMLRGKAVKNAKGGISTRDKILSATDVVGNIAGIPVVAEIVNAVNKSALGRTVLDKVLGVHPDAPVPEYHSDSFRKRAARRPRIDVQPVKTADTTGKVVVFATCYGNRNEPELGEDLLAILEHNGIEVSLTASEKCCGMPKLELGDLKAVQALKEHNVPVLSQAIDQGYDILAPIPSCVLMFKQELPLLFADDADVLKIKKRIFDPFEYLMLRHKAGLLRTDFKKPLGKISYHVACHLRVQNIGLKTRDILQLIPDTTVQPIERCSGHDGTYGVKREFREASMKIAKPVIQRVQDADAAFYASDCPMAGHQIESGLDNAAAPTHPLKLLRMAYGV